MGERERLAEEFATARGAAFGTWNETDCANAEECFFAGYDARDAELAAAQKRIAELEAHVQHLDVACVQQLQVGDTLSALLATAEAALEYIVSREEFSFVECSEAEEIWRRSKEALAAIRAAKGSEGENG